VRKEKKKKPQGKDITSASAMQGGHKKYKAKIHSIKKVEA